MNFIYVVYREDNTLVFNTQVLEYLKFIGKEYPVKLILFRNQRGLLSSKKTHEKLKKYVSDYHIFITLPVLSMFQLFINSMKLKLLKIEDTETIVICRGELATFVAINAFKMRPNFHILFDNRGLPVEESEYNHGSKIIHKLNREIKKKAIIYSKDHCNSYSFVTKNLREYLIEEYKYIADKKYFIIPTFTKRKEFSQSDAKHFREQLNLSEKAFIVTYIGSHAKWQSINELFSIFSLIKKNIIESKLLLLTNDVIDFTDVDSLIRESIIHRNVPHYEVYKYLAISNAGIVIRDDNIINRVSSPTKIAEYITQCIPIIYKGELGIFQDIQQYLPTNYLIEIDEPNFVEKLNKINDNKKHFEENIDLLNYFDMEIRFNEIVNVLINNQ